MPQHISQHLLNIHDEVLAELQAMPDSLNPKVWAAVTSLLTTIRLTAEGALDTFDLGRKLMATKTRYPGWKWFRNLLTRINEEPAF